MQSLELTLLGAPAVMIDGAALQTDRRKALALLAYLAVDRSAHSREALAALFWPGYPQASAFAYLRRTLWELNQALGRGWLDAGRDFVALVRQPGLRLDVDQYENRVTCGETTFEGLVEASALYRGDFLQGLVVADTAPFEDWQRQQTEYFRRLQAGTLEKLCALAEERARQSADPRPLLEQALGYARRWQRLDSLSEPAARARMRLLDALGERSAALQTYQTLIQDLQRELGVEPEPETRAQHQALLNQAARIGTTWPGADKSVALKPGALPPAAQPFPDQQAVPQPAVSTQPGSLPTPPTPFIGRRPELDEIAALLLDPAGRLLTLQGPGGSGKSRLAIQTAREQAERFPGGAWFVPLAPVQSPGLIAAAIARALAITFIKEEDSPRQQLIEFLRERSLLLVLDNFEHLQEGGGELVSEILAACPHVQVLVTSRLRLQVQGEQVYRVGGMRVPDLAVAAAWDDPLEQSKAFSAIQLLLERARRVQPAFQLSRQNLLAAAEICRLVDGSPLGIELAVAWLPLLSPQEIAAEIARSLDFLTGSSPDLPARQRSLRAVFESSWQMLNSAEQQAFRRLCVFQGGFSRPAAQVVSDANLPTLLGLANKSWLQQTANGRFQLHELLRQYGLERLQAEPDEWRAAKDRHAHFYAGFVGEQSLALKTSAQVQALDTLKSEMAGNLNAAWDWLCETRRVDLIIDQMLPGLYHYWAIRSELDEMLTFLRQALESAPQTTNRADLLRHSILEGVLAGFELGWVQFGEATLARMDAVWKRIQELDLRAEMGFWYYVFLANYCGGMYFEAETAGFRSEPPERPSGLSEWEIGLVHFLTAVLRSHENTTFSRQQAERALALFRRIGVVDEQGQVQHILARLAAADLDFPRAIEHCQLSRRLFEQAQDPANLCGVLIDLADYQIYIGEAAAGFQVYTELKGFLRKTGSRRLEGQVLSWESMALARFGSLEQALVARQKSLEIACEVAVDNDIAWHTWELGDIYRLLGDLELARCHFDAALPLFEAIHENNGISFYHRGLGDIALMQGRLADAEQAYRQSLAWINRELRSSRLWGLIYTQAKLGMTLLRLGRLEESEEFLRFSLLLDMTHEYYNLKSLPVLGFAELYARRGQVETALALTACIEVQITTWNETRAQAEGLAASLTGSIPAGSMDADRLAEIRRRGRALILDDVIAAILENHGQPLF